MHAIACPCRGNDGSHGSHLIGRIDWISVFFHLHRLDIFVMIADLYVCRCYWTQSFPAAPDAYGTSSQSFFLALDSTFLLSIYL